jgi:CHAT domain-containing protein
MFKSIFLLLILSASVCGGAFSTAINQVDTTAAHNFLQKASEFRSISQYDSSTLYLELAAEEFRRNEIWHRFLFCHYNIGYNYSSLYKHQDALDHMDRIETSYSQYFDPARASTFGFYWQVAWGHFKLENYTKALMYYDKVLEAMDLCQDPVGMGRRIRIVYDKGVIFMRLRQYQLAMEYNSRVLEMGKLHEFYNYESNALNNLGIINRKIGEYESSLNYYTKAFNLAKESYESKGGNLVGLCPFYVNFSLLFREMGDVDRSLESIADGIRVYEENAERWWSVYSSLKYNEVEAYYVRGEYKKALEEIQQALTFTKEQGGKGLALAGAYRYVAKSFFYLHQYDSAEAYFNKYLELTKGLRSFVEGNAQVQLDIGQLFAAKGQLKEAVEEVQKGIVLVSDGFNSQEMEDNPNPDVIVINSRYLLNLMSLKTEYLLELSKEDEKYLQLAYDSNRSARALVEQMRNNLYYRSSKLALSEYSNKIFEQGIIINQQLYRLEETNSYLQEMLSCFEGNRANLLAEAFQVSKVNGFTNLPDSLIKAEVEIFNEIAEKENLILRSSDSSALVVLREELFALKSRYEQIIESKRNNQYSAEGDHAVTNFQMVQSKLSRDEMILEYFAGESNFHLVSITADDIVYFNLGSAHITDSLVSRFVEQIKDPNTSNYMDTGLRIFNDYVKPAIGSGKKTSIILIPDGSLNFLPFEALTIDEGSTSGSNSFLIQEYHVRSHYSVSLFVRIDDSDSGEEWKSYIGFAPEFNLKSSPELASRTAVREELVSLEKLPGAEQEVRTAADFLNGEAIVGSVATESFFKENAANYNLIHLASHTLVDTEKPLYSTLVFAEDDSGEDGLLHLYELYGMKLNSSLVSLSACNTGIGRSYKGEGMMSLGRGFMGAGARNVLMTLWSVSDQSSGSIMSSFFEKLKNEEYEPEALRMAKLEYLEKADELTSHPYYWSGFTFIGNGTKKESHFDWWLAATAVLIGGFAINKRFRAGSRPR